MTFVKIGFNKKFKSHFRSDGTCWRQHNLANKTETPGRFTFTSPVWNNENDMRFVDVQSDDYAVVYTIKTKAGVSDVLTELYSKLMVDLCLRQIVVNNKGNKLIFGCFWFVFNRKEPRSEWRAAAEVQTVFSGQRRAVWKHCDFAQKWWVNNWGQQQQQQKKCFSFHERIMYIFKLWTIQCLLPQMNAPRPEEGIFQFPS